MAGGKMDRRRVLGLFGISGLVCGQAAKSLTQKGGRMVTDILNSRDFHGRISPAQSKELQQSEGKSVDDLMVALLPVAQTFARAPISKFQVGAVVRGMSGTLYMGANMEFPGQSLGLSVHAEQASCSNAYMNSDEGIAAIVVTAAPCGLCRQFLEELSPSGAVTVIVKGQAPIALQSLLPAAFGPNDLGLKHGALPINRVKLALSANGADSLAAAALKAASMSYAPYTKSPSGVAVRLADGSIYSGAYIENAAFNPSIPPLQVALVAASTAHKALEQVTDAVLVELDKAVISQESVTKAALASFAPKARLRTAIAQRAA